MKNTIDIRKQAERFTSGFLFIFLVILLSSLLGFGLGRLSKIEEISVPVRIERAADVARENRASALESVQGVSGEDTAGGETAGVPLAERTYVASKNGTKYHFPWCSGAQRIHEENKIWFATKEEAESAGYTPAANCKGI